MADASLGVAVLQTRLDTSGLRAGLAQARSETQRATGDMATAIRSVGAAFGSIASSTVLRSYVGFLTSAASEAQRASAAHALFERALQRNNQSAAAGRDMIARLSEQFGVHASVIEDAATTMLRQGATLEQVEKTFVTAGASAAAAGADIERAFENVTTAVISGNSVLLRSSGIISNLGEAERVYAAQLGKTTDALTDQERIQARVTAIYNETRYEIEDLDTLLAGLPRAQAEVNKQWREFRDTAGDMTREVLTPLTEALGRVLGLVNDLPEPVKRAGVAMTGAAIAGTALATGITAIRTALTGLSALGLATFGPAGWIVLGVTAVAGLAAALTGAGSKGQASLETAADQASRALAGGGPSSLTAALETLSATLEGGVKDAVDSLKGSLVELGDASAHTAEIISAVLELDYLSGQYRRAAEDAERFGEATRLAALSTAELNAIVNDRTFTDAERLQARLLLSMSDNDRALMAAEYQRAVAARDELAAAIQAQEALITSLRDRVETEVRSRPRPAAPAGEGSGAAAVLGDPAEEAKAWVDRLEAELRFGLKRPGEVINLLAPRVEELRVEASTALSEFGFDSDRYRDTVAKLDVLEGSLRRILALAGTPLTLEPVAEVSAARPLSITPSAAVDTAGLRSVADIERDLAAARAAVRAAGTAEARAEAQAVVLFLEDELRKVTRGVTLAIQPVAEVIGAARALGITPQAVLPEARPLGITPTAEVAGFRTIEAIEADIRAARAAVRTAASDEARHEAQLVVMELERELERLKRQVTPRELGIEPRVQLARPLGIEPTAQVAPARSVVPEVTVQIDGMDPAEWARQQRLAADSFAQTVVDAGFRFGEEAIRAIQDGDIPGLIRAGLSGAGSVFGAANLGSIPFLGGGIGIGTLIAGGLGVLGTLIGALTGGRDRERLEGVRAAGAAARSVPAIELNLVINQSLSVQSLTDPASRGAVNGLLDDMVRRIQGVVERNIIPRIERLEAQLA